MRSSLSHFACIGVAPPRLFEPQAKGLQKACYLKGSNSNTGKMDQTWSNDWSDWFYSHQNTLRHATKLTFISIFNLRAIILIILPANNCCKRQGLIWNTCRVSYKLLYSCLNHFGNIRSCRGSLSSIRPCGVCRKFPRLFPWSLPKITSVFSKVPTERMQVYVYANWKWNSRTYMKIFRPTIRHTWVFVPITLQI